MLLTAEQLNRTTLQRQLLLRREQVSVADATARVVGLQAQSPASPYVALWGRVHRFDPADLDAAFAAGSIVKASLMRVTLHAVSATDYPAFHQAMQATLRAARLVDPRRVTVGRKVVDPDELVASVVQFAAVPRTGREIQDRLEELTSTRDPRLWRAVRTFAPLHHVPGSGPWSFAASSSFVAAPAEARSASTATESTGQLLLRYLEGFGPASARDFGQFTMLPQSVVQTALAALGDRVVEHTGPHGERLFDITDGRIAEADTGAPARLLAMWDSTLLAYADRSRMVDPEHRPWVMRRNGDVLPTMLVDGRVAGVWRVVPGGVEATAFTRLDPSAWAGLAQEAAGLCDLVADRDPEVYRRYHHWWDKDLAVAERRLLDG